MTKTKCFKNYLPSPDTLPPYRPSIPPPYSNVKLSTWYPIMATRGEKQYNDIGPKHLRSFYFCELSLHTEFQSNSTSPSIRLFMALQQQQNNRTEQNNEKVNENSGNLVPSLLRKGDQSFSLNAPRQGKRRRSCQYHLTHTRYY